MQIVCISRGTLSGGQALAEKLAEKLGYDCLSREELTEAATRAGIAVGKLEMTVVRRRPMDERLALEKERYKAFVTATLCERAMKNSLVYHGRTAHLVLPGLRHVLRVRVIQDPEQRINSVMNRLGLSRAKAQHYIEQVDDDRQRWVRTLYGTDWQDPRNYDVVVNLSRMVVDNAAAAMVNMVRLPEFQVTPALQRNLQDQLLAARCRLLLGSDQRTREMDVRVHARGEAVTVTYLPLDAQLEAMIPQVLEGVAGVAQITCTMASTNLLWIQERFDPASPAMEQVLDVAGKWNAAVELMQLVEVADQASEQETSRPEGQASLAEPDGGILDDSQAPEHLDEGLSSARQRLIEAGRAGSIKRVVARSAREVLGAVDRSAPYSLVVVGDVFCRKNHAARTRLTSEMVSLLSESLRVPVVAQQEIKSQFLFGPGQWFKMLLLGALSAFLFFMVFTHQEQVCHFFLQPDTLGRVLAVATLMVAVPLVAYCYGTFTRLLLRLLRFE